MKDGRRGWSAQFEREEALNREEEETHLKLSDLVLPQPELLKINEFIESFDLLRDRSEEKIERVRSVELKLNFSPSLLLKLNLRT